MTQDTSRPAVILIKGEVLVRLELAAALEGAGMRAIPLVNGDEALQVLPGVPNLRAVVIDAEAPPASMSGFELARTITDEHHVGVVIVSGRGASGLDELPSGVYVLTKPFHHATLVKLVQELVRESSELGSPFRQSDPHEEPTWAALDSVTGYRLTRRQREVLELVLQGKSNRDIAQALGPSENTVKVHLAGVFRILSVHSRAEAILAGMRLLQHQ